MRAFDQKYVKDPTKHAMNIMVTLKPQSMKLLTREMPHKNKVKSFLDTKTCSELGKYEFKLL